jgi:hypothetical protein
MEGDLKAPAPSKSKKSWKKPGDIAKDHVCPYVGCDKRFNRPFRLKQHIAAIHTNQVILFLILCPSNKFNIFAERICVPRIQLWSFLR